MKFSTRQDIEAPIEFVFSRVSDFQSFERQAMRRGIDIERADTLADNGVGMRWNVNFEFRNRPRHAKAELTLLEAPSMIEIRSTSSGIDAEFGLELLALSKKRTRLKVGLELTPRTLSARLLLQSLKFAKSNLSARFASRAAVFGEDIENRYDGTETSWV